MSSCQWEEIVPTSGRKSGTHLVRCGAQMDKERLTRAINWILIRQQYDQMVKYATALRLGIAETESILRPFTRSNLLDLTYKDLAELGRAMKTIFLCRYLHSLELRREINEGLNVVETRIAPIISSFTAKAESSRPIAVKIKKSRCSRCTCSNSAWSISTR